MGMFEKDFGFLRLAASAGGAPAGQVQWTLSDCLSRIPKPAAVSSCQILEAKVTGDQSTAPLELVVTLTAREKPARFELAHGEWLYAAEGRIGKGVAAIGTHDAEWLATQRLPAAILSADVHDDVARLAISLPQAVVRIGTSLRFAIAWVDDWAGKADLEVAPWLALSHALDLPDIPESRA
ncbi:MAG: hypothetical protein RL291_1948 [Pseudomonadota bacterium]|jgi:hypothetical protein